jgi:hypothetical protein
MSAGSQIGGRYAELIDLAAREPRDALRGSVLGHQEAYEELAGSGRNVEIPVGTDTARWRLSKIRFAPLIC